MKVDVISAIGQKVELCGIAGFDTNKNGTVVANAKDPPDERARCICRRRCCDRPEVCH